ncbi:ABC transporter transmembrane domain-containing protein [Lutibacter sp.]
MKTKWQLIAEFIKKNKSLVITAFISGLFYNIIMLLIPVSLGRFYEFNFGFSSKRLKLLESMPFINTKDFNDFLFFFIGLVLIRFIFEFVNRYVISIIGERFAKNLREQLFEHQLHINTHIYDQRGIGKYLLRYSGDLKSIQNYVTKGLFRFLQDFILIVILIITIAYINSKFALIVTVFIGIAILLLFFINNILYTISVSRRNQRSAMLTFVNTRLRAIISIKAFNKYTPEKKRYNKRSEKLYNVGKKYQQVISFIQSIIPTITYLMLALLMWYIYTLKIAQTTVFNASELLILILLIISFLPLLRRTLRVSIIWKLGNISFEKLLNIFSLEAENKLSFEKINLSEEKIYFRNVAFAYFSSNNFVFKKLNISIFPKKTTLILGASGSGKSTFINLLLKIYNPTEGVITFGEYNYNDLAEKTIRKNISVISDEFSLYGRTVYEAIVYSRLKETEIKASKILKELQLYEAKKNKLQLHDYIGDLGSKLTSGQKKILMYCRALLTNKPILIIDRPFEGLNTNTITHLQTIINSLKPKKTIIILDSTNPKGIKADYNYILKKNTLTEQS